ncbi:Cell division protein FtsZ [Thermotoga neapolitana DSM 4359]|uniref:Cell division protein FtsZ n=1 Tax=Thermotoga neapolitana (strain ATCC 49049 / DSM 4359 / NBRC 107923 / NS-E) TaxID=309803 RepID=B9K818_THENN|nr:Cell division protein FtsZ [Thermotoga neapolitana DSM 4359]
MFFGRENTFFYFLFELLKSLQNRFVQVCVPFGKAWRKIRVQSQKVVPHKNLAIAETAGSNTDRRNGDTLCDLLCHFFNDHLQNYGERSPFFQFSGTSQEVLSAFFRLSLDSVTSKAVHELRCESDVSHHRNSRFNKPLYDFPEFLSTFYLNRICSHLQEPSGVLYGLLQGRLVGKKRHIGDHKGFRCSSSDRRHMYEHLFHRHRDGVFVPKNVVSQGISNEYDIYPRILGYSGTGSVVCCDHHDLFFTLHLLQFFHVHSLPPPSKDSRSHRKKKHSQRFF